MKKNTINDLGLGLIVLGAIGLAVVFPPILLGYIVLIGMVLLSK